PPITRFSFFFLTLPPPPRPTLFPYTTLFRSKALARRRVVARRPEQRLDKADQRRERRLQLVPGIGDKIGAHLLAALQRGDIVQGDRKSTRLNSSHLVISYAVFCLKKKKKKKK